MGWHDYLIASGIFIAFVITTFLLLIFMPKPKSYFDVEKVRPELMALVDEKNNKYMLDELFKDGNSPIYDKNNISLIYDGEKMRYNIDDIPITYSLLRSVPDIRCVFMAKIDKKLKTSQHKGSAEYSNNTLRCIIPLKISAAKKSGIWNDGETKFFLEREIIIHDDSRPHSVFNKHKRKETHLLVIDFVRPVKFPTGIATEKHNILFNLS